MKKLIESTTAYAAFCGDVKNNRASHAYLLHFQDAKNMRLALKIFALKFFGESEYSADGKRILGDSFSDFAIYPEPDKKFTVDAASSMLADCALKPLERDKKLFSVCAFDDAAPLVQNKLLKTLEDPNDGVYFLLGATSLAPVLDTVKSRVKTLTIPPFSESEIFSALERKGANPLNGRAAESCGGIFGTAENMIEGGWFNEVYTAAEEICCVTDVGKAGELAVKYGDIKYKSELLSAMAANYHRAVTKKAGALLPPALICACESVDRANRDLKFNANFAGLLYDLMLRVIKENERWLKLRR